MRRRLKTPLLKLELFVKGTKNQTEICLFYMADRVPKNSLPKSNPNWIKWSWNPFFLLAMFRLVEGKRGCFFGLTTIWNYTILKLSPRSLHTFACLTTIWNYTILKPTQKPTNYNGSLTTIWNYTILKRFIIGLYFWLSLTTIWNYTILKLDEIRAYFVACLTTIWNYTILKLGHCTC